MNVSLSPQLAHDLAQYDSPTITNAIDSFQVRLRNEGFIGSVLACRTPLAAPMVGLALTLKVRTAEPPMKRDADAERSDWWERIPAADFPRILVLQDMDAHPGKGSLVGHVHSCILRAMGFTGVITDGAVRSVNKINEAGLAAFSAFVSPAHSYCHLVSVGEPVELAGVRIHSGDIVHGDPNGIVTIPAGIAAAVPAAAARYREQEERICAACQAKPFSAAALRREIEATHS